jgi:DNA-binding NarL/FixJ family response regulator
MDATQAAADTIKVVLADDHSLFREGIRKILEEQRDMKVVAEAATGLDVQKAVSDTAPDVVLMDISMPVADGVSATREILRARPDTGVIIITMHHEDGHLFQALRAGARGYLLKTSKAEDVVKAVRTVYEGGSFMDPTVQTKVLDEFSRLSEKAGVSEGIGALSETEMQLLRLVAAGLSNREIADRLAYAERTIKNRLSVLFEKISVRDRTQAAVYAITHGILPAEAPLTE